MDRRDFLKVGSAAAVAVGGASSTSAQTAPAILPGATELRLASPALVDVPGFGPDRLARRIELVTGGRYHITAAPDAMAADLVFGDVNRHRNQHPAFAYFAGLPLGIGLDPVRQQTWLAIGGGQMLWDDLAGGFGFKSLVAGHTGPSGGIWTARRLETASDLSGARVHVEGLAAEVMRAFGAAPVHLAHGDLRSGLAEGRIDAADLLAPLLLAAPDLQPLAERLYTPGLNAGGALLSLDVRLATWNRLGSADQAIFEACAAEACAQSLVEVQGHQMMTAQLATTAKWPLKSPLGPQLRSALERTAHDVLGHVAGHDLDAQRIHDSYQAFRGMLGQPIA